jgi:murein L,D-transpeptidase YafK
MKRLISCFSLICLFHLSGNSQSGFEKNQKKFERVRDAYKIRETEIINNIQKHGLKENNFRLLLMASKTEQELHLFAGQNSDGSGMKLIRNFKICKTSGVPGPKTRQGDDQIPEGFYHISRFNPESGYHLAMEISYPGRVDRVRNKNSNPGGDIMIHGSCVTIGCLPMTNEGIEEIYIYAIKARNNGQKDIPVYIFPAWPDGDAFRTLLQENSKNGELCQFWNNLALGYSMFREKGIPLRHSASKSGEYVFQTD